MTDSPHLTVEELARRERTSESTVHGWVHKGTAPRSMRIGRRRLFKLEDVIAWENANADRPTAAA